MRFNQLRIACRRLIKRSNIIVVFGIWTRFSDFFRSTEAVFAVCTGSFFPRWFSIGNLNSSLRNHHAKKTTPHTTLRFGFYYIRKRNTLAVSFVRVYAKFTRIYCFISFGNRSYVHVIEGLLIIYVRGHSGRWLSPRSVGLSLPNGKTEAFSAFTTSVRVYIYTRVFVRFKSYTNGVYGSYTIIVRGVVFTMVMCHVFVMLRLKCILCIFYWAYTTRPTVTQINTYFPLLYVIST